MTQPAEQRTLSLLGTGHAEKIELHIELHAPMSSIVVLPFADMSPQKDQEYFCHGLTEEIINSLTTAALLRSGV